MTLLISIVGVVFALGLVIFVHEFGHFIVAKKSGVKVERFSFGMGPEAVGFQWGETRYCISWIPLGGEVRMAGDMDLEDRGPERPRDPREFFAKPWYRRIPIVVAGPAMNYVLAFCLFSLVFFCWGNPRPSTESVIGDLVGGYPAEKAGLKANDRITAVGGKAVADWTEAAAQIHGNPDKPIKIDILRAGEKMSFSLTPRRDPRTGEGLIGIAPATTFEKVGFAGSLVKGGEQTVGWTLHTLRYLWEKIYRREKPELSGPLGIVTVISKTTQTGLQDYLFLIALISLGIGLFNLFPIPMLDGGHLMFYLWEGIFRRPASRKTVQTANAVGLSLLLGILLFATYSDIQRLRTPAETPAAPSAGK